MSQGLLARIVGGKGVKWELGLTYFLAGEMGLGLLGLGFGHWEWEMKSLKMEMGLKYSKLISNFFYLTMLMILCYFC